MKKVMTVTLLACGLVACGGGTQISGPSETVTQTPVAAVEPVVTQPVAEQPPAGSSFEVDFKDRAGFRVNYVGNSGARVVAFITSFDDQDTPLASKQRDLTANQAWEDTFDATCVQLDIDQPGVKLIAAAFYDKEGRRFKTSDSDAGAKIEACRCTPTWNRSEQFETIYGSWVVNGCSKSRTVTRRYTETQTCTNATRTVDIVSEPQVEANALAASYTLGTLSFPALQYRYGQFLTNIFEDTCTGQGGSWSNKFCTFNSSKGNSWPGGIGSKGYTLVGGNPISGSATIANAGTYKLVLKATDPGNYDKDIDTKTLVCGQSATLNVDYSWSGHNSDDWFLQLYLNNVLVATSPVVNNPSN